MYKSSISTDIAINTNIILINIFFFIIVINRIEGGSVEVVGFSTLIYFIISAVVTIPIGILMDKVKGYVDERNILFFSTLGRGVLLIFFAYIKFVWQLYLLQFLLGIVRASMLPAWRILFSKYADNDKEGLAWSTVDSITTIGMGLAAYLGSLIVEQVSYTFVFQVAGGLTLLGAFLQVLLKMFIKK